MVNTIVTILLIILFFFLGHITQAFKKIIILFTNLCLKILNIFGIKITKKERKQKLSEDFKNAYKDIKTVKISRKNIKQKHSIDFLGLTVLIIATILVIVNLASVSGNAISNWIFSWIKDIKIIKTAADMNTFYTAFLFSIISFSISRLISRWKETKQQRLEAKNEKLKKKAVELMSSKELVEQAKKKDESKYNELK